MHYPIINGFVVTVYSSTLVRTNQKSKIKNQIRMVPGSTDSDTEINTTSSENFNGTPEGRYHLPLLDILQWY